MGRTRSRGSATPATRRLDEAGVPYEVHTFEVEDRARRGRAADRPAFGEEAARALGVEEGRVFKTLVADVDGRLHIAVVPVDRQLDLKALAAAVAGKRAAMADPALAARTTGYVVGGISPLGVRTPLPTVVDEVALSLDRILVSGGRRGMDIALAPADLVRLAGATTAAISRP